MNGANPPIRQFETQPAPHRPPRNRVQRVMLHTLIALLPGVAASLSVFGIAVLLQIALAIVFALLIEAICLKLRNRALKPFLSDGSAVLTAVLFALCLPPTMPWWSALIGMLFAIGVAKHLYGGLGNNVFNPAMIGYVVVLLSFPLLASKWPDTALTTTDALALIFSGHDHLSASQWDALTGATVLDQVRELHQSGYLWEEIQQQANINWPAASGQNLIAVGYLLGGIYLVASRIISHHVPTGVITGVTVLSLAFWMLDPSVNPDPFFHLFAGGLMLGAFFIATDPVSGASTPRARLLFGLGVAVLTLAIRRWGGFPDAVAFAVLLMNLLVPLLDQHTQPRVYGHERAA